MNWTLPAVVTVSDSINEPRLPQMRGLMMAKKKKINVMDLAALGTSFEEVGGTAQKSEITEYMKSETRTGRAEIRRRCRRDHRPGGRSFGQ